MRKGHESRTIRFKAPLESINWLLGELTSVIPTGLNPTFELSFDYSLLFARMLTNYGPILSEAHCSFSAADILIRKSKTGRWRIYLELLGHQLKDEDEDIPLYSRQGLEEQLKEKHFKYSESSATTTTTTTVAKDGKSIQTRWVKLTDDADPPF